LSMRVVRVRDALARDEHGEEVVDKGSFDGASSGGAGVGVQGLARSIEVTSRSGTSGVRNLPRSAVKALILRVADGTFVALAEDFAHGIDLVDRVTFAASDVVVKVAPASVFIEVGDLLCDLTGEGSERAVLDHGQELLINAGLVGSDEGESGGSDEFHC